jgi:DNA gyrase subunit A
MSETTPPPAPDSPLPAENDKIRDLSIERELQDSYLTYAMSTIMDRALPDVRDGLKPSQRRILLAMHNLNLTPGRKHIKCAKICGDTSGDFHPHGEAVIYPTLVRMGQEWSTRYLLIDKQGNFGSSDGDPPAAMRYTEARMTSATVEMMADLDYDTVDFVPNYDERPGKDEPVVLPGKFPNLLVNGSTGIAVGMACNLVPHNVREICDAIVAVINNPQIDLPELLKIVPGPDFPTGGIIRGRDGIIEGYKTGRGKMQLQAKVEIEEERGRHRLVVTEIPYGVIRKNIVEDVVKAHKDGNMPDVSGVNDESGRLHKVRIVIDLKRDADPEIVKRQLYQFSQAQVTVSIINIAIVRRQPRTMGLKELIFHFLEHRKEVITRRTRFLLRKALQRAHILEGQILAVCDIDEVVKLIRTSRTREEAMTKLRAKAFRIAADHPLAPKIPARLLERPGIAERGITLSQAQAEAIAALRLIQLVGLEIDKLADEYKSIVEEIENYEAILADPQLVLDIIREDTIEMKEKFGDDRRTQIEGEASDYNYESLITPHDVVVTLSHNGYIKRLPVDTYKSQGRGGRGIKGGETRDGDFVEHLFVANTHDHLLFFTNKGRVYAERVFDVPEMSRTSLGRSVANLLEFQEGEKIAQVLTIKDFNKDESFLIFATEKGTVKKTALSAYANINRRGIIAIGLEEGDNLIEVGLSSGKDHILLATKSGLAIRFEEGEVRAMGRTAGGVTGARFKREGDAVVSMVVIPDGSNDVCCLLTACVNGYGKRSPLSAYPVKGRGTRGVADIDTDDRNGDVVGVKLVSTTDELMMITQNGILIRTRAADVSEVGRNTKGVRLIRLDDGDKLVGIARVDAEEVPADTTAGEIPPTGAPSDEPSDSTDSTTDSTPPAKPQAAEDTAGDEEIDD